MDKNLHPMALRNVLSRLLITTVRSWCIHPCVFECSSSETLVTGHQDSHSVHSSAHLSTSRPNWLLAMSRQVYIVIVTFIACIIPFFGNFGKPAGPLHPSARRQRSKPNGSDFLASQ